MAVGSIGSGASWTVPAAGSPPADPQAHQAQVNAQADQLSAMMATKHSGLVAANIADGKGVDLLL
jgi:hypothetical protein